jgi:hypothetical protein
VYVATDAGVYASANATAGSGSTWSVLQTGLPNSQVLSLRLNTSSRTLVAATHGRGMWNIKLPTSSAKIALNSLTPVSATAGDAAFLLTATGSAFTSQSEINFNGTTLSTTFVNGTTLTATVPTAAISCAGPLFVSVTDPAAGSTNPLRFTVGGGCDFSFGTVTPATQTVAPGGTATYQIVLNTAGSNADPVQLSCPGAPAGITCQFATNPVTPLQGGTTVALTVSVPASAAAPVARIAPPQGNPTPHSAAEIDFAILTALFLAFQFASNANRKSALSRIRNHFSLAAVLILAGLIAACGGGSGGGVHVQPQTFTIQIQGVSQNFQHLTSVQLVVD